MNKRELSNLVMEKVFHRCRHFWVVDSHFAHLSFNTILKCPLCKRSSLTAGTVTPAEVGSYYIGLSENHELALQYLRKMLDMYDCRSHITIADKDYVCVIMGTTKEATSRGETLPVAIALTMVKYVTGEEVLWPDKRIGNL